MIPFIQNIQIKKMYNNRKLPLLHSLTRFFFYRNYSYYREMVFDCS